LGGGRGIFHRDFWNFLDWKKGLFWVRIKALNNLGHYSFSKNQKPLYGNTKPGTPLFDRIGPKDCWFKTFLSKIYFLNLLLDFLLFVGFTFFGPLGLGKGFNLEAYLFFGAFRQIGFEKTGIFKGD